MLRAIESNLISMEGKKTANAIKLLKSTRHSRSQLFFFTCGFPKSKIEPRKRHSIFQRCVELSKTNEDLVKPTALLNQHTCMKISQSVRYLTI